MSQTSDTPSSSGKPAGRSQVKKNGSKRVSHRTIAESVGVSRAAVSHVLNGREHMVSEATCKKILNAVKETGYHRNALVRALKSDTTHVVGILVPTMDLSVFSNIVCGAELVAKREGWQVFFCQTHSLQERVLEEIQILREYRVDGLIIVTVNSESNVEEYRTLKRDKLPFVLVDVPADNVKTSFVGNDQAHGAYISTKHLIESGHKRIVLIKGYHGNPNMRLRLAGYQKALSEHELPFDENLVFDLAFTYESGVEAAKELLKKETVFDAIIASSDHCALGAIDTLQDHGLRVPNDISVIGWGNNEMSRYVTPRLTTLDQKAQALGDRAMCFLLDQISKKKQTLKSEIIRPELVLRNSTKAR